MKHLTLGLLLAVFALAVVPASATIVTIQFNSTGSNTYQGEAAYPYYGTVDGNASTFACISFDNHISYGESWKAQALPLDSFGGPTFRQAGWLFEQAVADGGADSNIQGAMWDLFSNNVPTTPAELAWLAAASAHVAESYPNVTLYIPLAKVSTDVPQWFLGTTATTPEPGTLALLGSGILGIWGIRRRK